MDYISSTIFRFDAKNKLCLDKEALKICPNLKNIDEKKLLYIVCVYDYRSPFHKFPEQDRIRKAKIFVWNDIELEIEKDKFLLTCIDDYKSLQYDVRRETIKIYESKVAMLNNELMAEASPRRIEEIDKAIERLLNRMQKVQQEIDMDEEASRVIQGGQKLSLLEKWQENRRKFQQNQKNRKEAEGVAFI